MLGYERADFWLMRNEEVCLFRYWSCLDADEGRKGEVGEGVRKHKSLGVHFTKGWETLLFLNCKLPNTNYDRMVVSLVGGCGRRIRDGKFPFVVAKVGGRSLSEIW